MLGQSIGINQTPNGQAFLQAVHLWQQTQRAGTEKRVFISYAWEPDKRRNAQLQHRLTLLRDDLEAAGFKVFFDLAAMQGKFDETMRQHLRDSDVIIPVCTPQFFTRVQDDSTNVAFEYRLTLEKGQVDPGAVMPILLEGTSDSAVPHALQAYPPLRDMRDGLSYSFNFLTAHDHSLGLLPALCGVKLSHPAGCYVRELAKFRLAMLNQFPNPNPDFVGRTELLDLLHQDFTRQVHLTLTGAEGIGKTELAIAYLHQHRTDYDFVHWIPAKTTTLMQQTFLPLAALWGIEATGLSTQDLVQSVYAATAAYRGLWVFDGADSSVLPYLPSVTSQHTLITSRQPLWHGRMVPVFTAEEAEQFLRKCLDNDFEANTAEKLAKLTGYLPLALKQAVIYLRDMQISLATYNELLENQDLHLSSDDNSLEDDTHAAILATLRQTVADHDIPSILKTPGGATFLSKLKVHYQKQSGGKSKRLFISTVYDSSHSDWLIRQLSTLHNDLTAAGFEVYLPMQATTVATPLGVSSVLDSDFVMLICIPELLDCIQDTQHPRYWEYQAVLTKAEDEPGSIIPVRLRGDFSAGVPRELRGFMAYDLTNPVQYLKMLTGLVAPKGILPVLCGASDGDAYYVDALAQFHRAQLTELPPKNPRFIGRQGVLAQIWQALESIKETDFEAPLVLHGTGGVGKSQTALHFAYQHFEQGDYQMVCWIQAETTETLLQSFSTMAERLGINTENVELPMVIRHIYQRMAGWDYLFVFDNAESLQKIQTFLPPARNPKQRQQMLVTSRNEQWQRKMALALFTEVEAIAFIQQALSHATTADGQVLAQLLGYLPLALNHAVAYIQQQQLFIPDYIALYQTKGIEILAQAMDGQDKHQETIATTWQLSLQKIEQQSSLAKAILLECAFLYPDAIPLLLIQQLPSVQRASKSAVLQAVKILRHYSLLESAGSDQVKIHRLLQSVINQQQLVEGQAMHVKRLMSIVQALGDTLADFDLMQKETTQYASFIPHAQQLIEQVDQLEQILGHTQFNACAIPQRNPIANDSEPSSRPPRVVLAFLMHVLGNLLNIARGNRSGQKSLLECALKIEEAYYGPDHPQLANTLTDLGNALGALGDAAGQKALLVRALKIEKAHYGPDHPQIAFTLSSLGNALGDLGDAAGQKALLECALEIQEAHYGPDHPHLAITLSSLGNALVFLGDMAGAKALFERALKIDEPYYGPDHPQVAKNLANLGGVLGALSDAAGGKVLLERALKILEKHYGPDHPQVARNLSNLSLMLGPLGDMAGKKELLERALKIQALYYGPDHPEVARTLANLGSTLRYLGDAVGAKALLERALRIEESYYGPDHPQVAKTLTHLADALGKLGDAAGKKALLERALRIEESYYGPDYYEVAFTLTNLGHVLGDLGDMAGAKVLLERALRIEESYYGSDHLEVASTLTDLSRVLGDLGDIAGAKMLLERALKIKEAHYGPDHPHLAITLTNLGAMLDALGDVAGQKALLERVLKIFEACYGPEHPQFAIILTNSGTALGKLGDVAGQKALLERALKIQEPYYGSNHPQVAITLANLAMVEMILNQFETALQHIQRAHQVFTDNGLPQQKAARDMLIKITEQHRARLASQTSDRGRPAPRATFWRQPRNQTEETPLLNAQRQVKSENNSTCCKCM